MASPSSVITMGFYGGPLVTLGYGSGEGEVVGTLVGLYQNVYRFDIGQPRIELEATNERIELSAGGE